MKSIITLITVLLIGLWAIFWYQGQGPATPYSYETPTDYTTPASGIPTPTNSLIRVTSPLSGASIRSPLTVTGEARGTWYFEASFPVKVLDANGKLLGSAPAQAQGEWMTTEFVPFQATFSFATSTTQNGTLVFEKDNPSGLQENAAEIRIPITFSTIAQGETRKVNLYFYNENKDKNPAGQVLCSAQGLVPLERQIPLTISPIQDAVKELLKGPTSAERAQVSGTEFPLAGVTLQGASLSGGALTLTFSDPQNKTGGGSCRVSILRAQIEATAKQFGGVNSVRFAPSSLFQP